MANEDFDWIEKRTAAAVGGLVLRLMPSAAIRWFRHCGPICAAFLQFICRPAAAEILYDSIQAFADRAQSQGADVVLETWEDMNHDLPDVWTRRAAKRRGAAADWRSHRLREFEGEKNASCLGNARIVEGRYGPVTSNSISTLSSSVRALAAVFPPIDLTEKGYRVAVMEMGRRWTPDNLPRTSWSIHRWFWRPKLGLRGFFNMRFFRHVTIFHGCAVGGGSITYASTLLRASRESVGIGLLGGIGRLESGNAAALSKLRRGCWA